MSKTYCPYIEHQMMVDFQGASSPCCMFELNVPVEEYYKLRKNFAAKMMQGEKIKQCRRCWEDEGKGFQSLRQTAIEDFKRYDEVKGLMSLDIRLTNNCNLACTMCSSHASSLWSKLTKANNFLTLNQTVQDQLIAESNNLVKVSIQGGEPFYGDEFINFVERLPNKENIQLEIFSNTITADINVIARWANTFKQVSFISSVDGYGKTFEDIRWPAKWEKYERKITELYRIKNLGLNFNFTLQNLNILNLGEFFNWRNATVPLCTITVSILEWPQHFQYTVLTEDERQQALQVIDSIKTDFESETAVLNVVKTQLLNGQENLKLLEVKQQQLANIQKLRENYLVRPERLELPHD